MNSKRKLYVKIIIVCVALIMLLATVYSAFGLLIPETGCEELALDMISPLGYNESKTIESVEIFCSNKTTIVNQTIVVNQTYIYNNTYNETFENTEIINNTGDLEFLKLQFELEKLKLERSNTGDDWLQNVVKVMILNQLGISQDGTSFVSNNQTNTNQQVDNSAMTNALTQMSSRLDSLTSQLNEVKNAPSEKESFSYGPLLFFVVVIAGIVYFFRAKIFKSQVPQRSYTPLDEATKRHF